MTCEWAEGNLSAYLDDALDPQLRKDVGAHIESCARCQALAEEYRRNDHLLATMQQVAPSDDLRQRLFESPAYAALTRDLEREASDGSPRRLATRRTAAYARVLVPVAALLTVSLGAGMLFKQGLLPFGAHPGAHSQTTTIGGPGSFDLPLSAGPRLVYLNGGALWSVAESAPNDPAGNPGAPQRLTSANVQVVAWSVSPQTASNGATRIAYVDGHTNALHIVHSDGQADTIVGSVSVTSAVGLVWSPDGAQLAYVGRASNGSEQVNIYSLTGVSTVPTASNLQEPITQLVWRGDSAALAALTTIHGAPTLLVLSRDSVTPGRAWEVAASPDVTQASVAQIAWSGSRLTWSTTRNGSIVGVYAVQAGSATPVDLTSGANHDAAAFTSAFGGVWLLAGNGALSEARPSDGSVTQVAPLDGAVSRIDWSPNGATASVLIGDRLFLWNASAGLTPLASNVTTQVAPAWSSDSGALVVAQGQTLTLYPVSGGAGTQIARLSNGETPMALAWAADGRTIAVAEAEGTLLVSTDGAHQTLLTSHAADSAALAWSIAR